MVDPHPGLRLPPHGWRTLCAALPDGEDPRHPAPLAELRISPFGPQAGFALAGPHTDPGPVPGEEILGPGTVALRRLEFRRGRLAAGRALWRAGCRLDAPLLPGPDRAPCWPPGWLGTITHTDGLALAAACPCSSAAGIGLDLERLDAPVEAGMYDLICTAGERRRLGADPADLLRLFSAKEAVYKALGPGSRMDFTDVELTPTPGGFSGIVTRDVPGFDRGAAFAVISRTVGPHVLSGVFLEKE